MKMSRLKNILQAGSLVSKIKRTKPSVTILHVGHQELWEGKKAEDILNDTKQLIYKILENTETKLCMSLVIPVTCYEILNTKIKDYNAGLGQFVTFIRKQGVHSGRLFTADNRKLGNHVTRAVSAHGADVNLTPKGENLLWLILRDTIDRVAGPGRNVEMGRDSYRRWNHSSNAWDTE